MIKYLAQVAAKKADKQGLILSGTIGSGKTALMLIWAEFMIKAIAESKRDPRKETYATRTVVQLSPSVLRSQFMADGFAVLEQMTDVDILILDDLQAINVVYFGMPVDVTEQLIIQRYDKFKSAPGMLFVATTNLVADELRQAIGLRADSRLSEMTSWNKGILVGNDRRKDEQRLKYWPNLNDVYKSTTGSPRLIL